MCQGIITHSLGTIGFLGLFFNLLLVYCVHKLGELRSIVVEYNLLERFQCKWRRSAPVLYTVHAVYLFANVFLDDVGVALPGNPPLVRSVWEGTTLVVRVLRHPILHPLGQVNRRSPHLGRHAAYAAGNDQKRGRAFCDFKIERAIGLAYKRTAFGVRTE